MPAAPTQNPTTSAAGLTASLAAGERTIRFDGRPLCAPTAAPLTLELDGRREPVVLDAAEPDGPGLALTGRAGGVRVRLRLHAQEDPAGAKLTSTLTLVNEAAAPILLTSIDHHFPAFGAALPGPKRLQVPGDFVRPDTPYESARGVPLNATASEPLPSHPDGWLDHAPDQGMGLVIVENGTTCLSAWHFDDQRAPAFTTLDGTGEAVDLCFRHKLCARLAPGERLEAEGPSLLVGDAGFGEHLAAFRRLAYAGLATAEAPDWARGLALLQIDARPIAGWTARLPRIAAMGFTGVYCMPVWENQGGNHYALAHHRRIDPAVGTEAELSAFVDEAHAWGIRVLFDFIPQGTGDRSDLAREHPDWLVRDERGRPFGSHGWGPGPGEPPTGHTLSLDWGREDVQRFLLEWARWNVETFGIDGFRTDALHWKEPNLGPGNEAPPGRTTFGGLRLGERLAEELGPDKLLLGELPGPAFARSHAATYENSWVLGPLNAAWLKGEPLWTAQEWCRWKRTSQAAAPAGLLRASFSSSHDLMDVAAAARQSPVADALAFAHAFSGGDTPGGGVVFVCWAELDWDAIDRGDDGRSAFFTDLLRRRAALGDATCSFEPDAVSGSEHLFCATWHAADGDRFALANLSVRGLTATVRGLGEVSLPPRRLDPPARPRRLNPPRPGRRSVSERSPPPVRPPGAAPARRPAWWRAPRGRSA